jgi:hypothetical protein
VTSARPILKLRSIAMRFSSSNASVASSSLLPKGLPSASRRRCRCRSSTAPALEKLSPVTFKSGTQFFHGSHVGFALTFATD